MIGEAIQTREAFDQLNPVKKFLLRCGMKFNPFAEENQDEKSYIYLFWCYHCDRAGISPRYGDIHNWHPVCPHCDISRTTTLWLVSLGNFLKSLRAVIK